MGWVLLEEKAYTSIRHMHDSCSSCNSLINALHVHQAVLSPADCLVNCNFGASHFARELDEVPSLHSSTTADEVLPVVARI
jgi:hypothetical protein